MTDCGLSTAGRSLGSCVLGVLLLGTAATAAAAPLTLAELDLVPLTLECHAVCNEGPASGLADCLAGCPAIDANWEKDGQSPVDMQDFDLAILEYWGEGSSAYYCYEGGAVLAAPACGLGECLSTHTSEECEDIDGDGIPAWQEAALGWSDSDAQTTCDIGADCSFVTTCSFVFELSSHICLPRSCGAATCTAFHLEEVAVNNHEVILYVHYDYSPVPANVLDLRLTYSETDLRLVDARALAPLVERNKEVAVTHPSAGVLRLVVLGAGSTIPIPTGAIVELVFQRTSALAGSVAFDTVDFYQRNSMAPEQGASQAELVDDSLWGSPIPIAASDPNGHRLVLSYTFDSPLQPLSYNGAPAAAALCDLIGPAACPPADVTDPLELIRRTKTLAQLSALQDGVTQTSQSIDGLSAAGTYLDGGSDHLELPVVLNGPLLSGEQDFSLSMWFYTDGVGATDAESEQILFSHNKTSEKTRFGLALEQESPTTAILSWFEEEYGSGAETKTVVASGLPLLTWTHLGLSVDAGTGEGQVFINGGPRSVFTLGVTPAIGCPQLGVAAASDPPVVLHEEGAITGGRAPETLFFASAQNNIYGLERMDLTGLSRRDVLRASDTIHRDPDYNPGLDKLVYSSNASGAFEIWLADGNGGNPQQITAGFGDTGRGVYARRPRWAPDGSAIIFESNAFNLAAFDNPREVYHLYYIAYDNRSNQVAVPLASGSTATTLDYDARVLDQSIADYRLTLLDDKNHNQVMWLSGKSAGKLGEVLFNVSGRTFDEPRVHRLTIPDPRISPDSGAEVPFPELPSSGDLRGLAAQDISPGGVHKAKLLIERTWDTLEAQALFDWSAAVDGEGVTTVTLTRSATGSDPIEVRDLYITYDRTKVTSDTDASAAGVGIGTDVGQIAKQVAIRDAELESTSAVRVELLSPTNNTPIPPGTEVATVVFRPKSAGDPAFALVDLVSHQALYVKDLADVSNPPVLPLATAGSPFERVTAAELGPNGDWLLFAAVSSARPVLVKARLVAPTDPWAANAVYSLSETQRVSRLTAKVAGMSWKKQEHFYACNWIGAYRDPYTKLYQAGLRGGLDEVRVYSYAREERAFMSDAERGFARLAAEGRSALVDSLVPQCSGLDTECPPFHQCLSNQCVMVACNPANPSACDNGLCTLRPASVEAADSTFDWVCATDCSSDIECQQQDCLNGPCRFCDLGRCIECEMRTEDFGSFQLTYPQGCPDRNSFSCDAGSCLTECYSFENGESRYLCDEALEYCHLGRCELFEWSWSELSPASLAGLGETRFDLVGMQYTVAQPQLYPITIKAYGVEDYLHSPEIMVEGRVETTGQQVFGAAWFEIGRVQVHNRTAAEADASPYSLTTSFPITGLRLRLVTPPMENLNAAATGLGSRDAAHCRAQAEAWAIQTSTQPDYEPCYRRASGSRFTLGYRAGIPTWEAYRACDERGNTDCSGRLTDDPYRHFLFGGQPAAIVEDLQFNGGSVLAATTSNTVCSYEGGLAPMDGARARKVVFGDAVLEQSNQREHLCAVDTPPSWCAGGAGLIERVTGAPPELASGTGVLNCNYFNPNDPLGDVAALVVPLAPIVESALADASIVETANDCRFTDTQGAEHSCYEVTGGEATIDPYNAPKDIYHTLDIDLFEGFAYENELVAVESSP